MHPRPTTRAGATLTVLLLSLQALSGSAAAQDGSAPGPSSGVSPSATAPRPSPPEAGTYAGEGLTLVLTRTAAGYGGTVSLNGKTYPLKGTFDPTTGLAGEFTAEGTAFAWTAAVEGGLLLFTTGGTTYHLNPPAPPKPEPSNPLARKPATGPAPTPSERGPAAAPGAQTLRFTKLSIHDPGINNIEAVSLLIPEGWKSDGGVTWLPNYSILANLNLTISDPASGGQIQTLPVQNFTWIDNPVMPLQVGSNYLGNIVHQPIRDIPEFIRTMYFPGALRHLGGARQVSADPLPEVERQITQAYGGMSQAVAAKVRYAYERNGAPWTEDVYVALVFTNGPASVIWSVNTAYAFRAPAADFERLAPLMSTTVASARLSLDWFAGYAHVQQLFMNRMRQGIQDAGAISRTIAQNSEEIRKMYSDAYRTQCQSQDRISRGFSEAIRGVDTYRNPFEDRSIELPSGYTDVWVNAQGQYLLSSQAGFDPNAGSTVEWRRMDRAP